MNRTLRAAALAVAVIALAGCSNSPVVPTAAATPTAGITTRGVGVVSAAPDTLTVVLGVSTRGPAAAGALADNSARATALIDTLTARGVAAEDLRTSGLSIFPSYSDTGRITGYEVSNQVTATVRDIAAAGGVIDAAAEAAGDAIRVDNIAFSIDDDSEQRATARADAVRLAQSQATQIAEAAGVALGPIVSITEVPATQAVPFDGRAQLESGSAVPLAPGTQDVTVTVEVVHAVTA